MEHCIEIPGLEALEQAASDFLEQTTGHKLIAFHARMGAGKTTFITALCKTLGVNEDAVSSPTFAIVNEYKCGNGEKVYHFDFYRIEEEEEALDLGLYDYLDSGELCLMEWPENIGGLMPEEVLDVYIQVEEDGVRRVVWQD